MKCPKCKSDNPGTATFCADCGTQLPSFEKIEVTETMETPKEELTTGSTFARRYQIVKKKCLLDVRPKQGKGKYLYIDRQRQEISV